METAPEYSLFLIRILEELDANHSTVSYQDLCKLLCARFDLTHLAKLRSLLFYTACLDPNFPATLFKEKLRCTVDDQQSKKIMVAADIVTMFNLIQMNGGAAKEKLPHRRQHKVRRNESFESCRSDTEICRIRSMDYASKCSSVDRDECSDHSTSRTSTICTTSDCKDCQRLICTSDPNFFLEVRDEGLDGDKGRAASLDRLQRSPTFNCINPPPCVMQTTYFPMDPDQESLSDQDSLPRKTDRNGTFDSSDEPFIINPCLQSRTVFSDELQDLLPCVPKLIPIRKDSEDEYQGPHTRKNGPRFSSFFSNSFELPYSNPYCDSVRSTSQEKRYVKHESLDDLQGSTYFGPSTIAQEPRRFPGKPSKQSAWPVKSWSLNNEEVEDFDKSFFTGKANEKSHGYQSGAKQQELVTGGRQRLGKELISTMDRAQPQSYQRPKGKSNLKQQADKPYGRQANEYSKPQADLVGQSSRENPRKLKDTSVNCISQILNFDHSSSVGTQTDQAARRKRKDAGSVGHGKYGEKVPLKQSDEEESEGLSDDISDIFRFLDDMSVSGSTGLLQSCYNSSGSLSRLPRSDCESTPERTPQLRVGPGASRKDLLDRARLAHDQPGGRPGDPGDEELKMSVCKLVLRIGEIERKLESLSGVRDEISQVLVKLNKLDEKIQEPQPPPPAPLTLDKFNSEGQAESHGHNHSSSPGNAQRQASETGVKAESACQRPSSDTSQSNSNSASASASNSESLRIKALKKSLFVRRSSRSLTEENSNTESKIASISNSPHDWRAAGYANESVITLEESKARVQAECKDWHRKSRETDRRYVISQSHKPSKPAKDSLLIEQVFSPHVYPNSMKSHMKSNPLYTDLRLTELVEQKRPHPSWTIEEYNRHASDKAKLAALEIQNQESLNPNNLEYWMEDIYTPGYDSLLKRKEAEFRRAKICKMAALIVAAVCTVILVIVVPICTMKS
ncbi:major intrinsically disordered Notch2-binding receptor 1 [Callorhinchus milii]|uniref:major intrinsically disordered Notch2-binding receptor 1 n=1 Tax=Callorhinchus milii TaxID=7868 RepID=UPI001C3F8FB9|nr:major intrinsically disordered Notch2-binding receptor 1 [Callorhinchus milii]